MDILHIVQGYFPARGGTEFLVQQISERLVAQFGDKVTVYTTRGYNTGFFVDPDQPAILHRDDESVNGVAVRRFPVNRRIAAHLAGLQHKAYVKDWPLNDVLRTLYHGPISWSMFGAILRARADVLVAASFPMLHMYYAALGRRINRVPVLFYGALHPEDRWNYDRPIIYRAISACDIYLANTEYERDHLISKGIPARKVRIASPGVDATPFETADGTTLRRMLGWENAPVIAYVGQQAAHKGIGDLYRAMRLVWRQLPEARLIVAGARTAYSPQLDTILRTFSTQERDRVHVVEDFSDAEKPEIFAACDVFVSASGHESFGITFIEAWATGKPVIGCRSGAIPTVIDEWRDGLLVPYRSPPQLASAILELLVDSALRQTMGARGREKVLTQHTWDIAVRRFRDAYEEAAGTRGAHSSHLRHRRQAIQGGLRGGGQHQRCLAGTTAGMIDACFGFDDEAYLALNPDVGEAVQAGKLSSGWAHYICDGYYEDRSGVPPGVPEAIKNVMEPDPTLPFPPKHLRKRVHGTEDQASFELIGRMVAFNIHCAANSLVALEEHRRILDFGCGCGRVLRYYHKLAGGCRFFGTDIDGEAISWCQGHLGRVGEFLVNDEYPPLPFGDEFFDLVFSISVFTHLPEDMQLAWLQELRRVTRRGGYLLLTTHGGDLFGAPSKQSAKEFQERGLCYCVGDGTEGLPSFYQTSYHTKEYVLAHWGRFFDIVAIIERGIAYYQDLVVCRRPIA